MPNCFKGPERRVERRLEYSLPISLLNYKLTSDNISPSGVYFEMATDEVEPFSLGRTVDLEILAKAYTPVGHGKTFRLTGIGKIVRNNKTGNKKYGIALLFNEKLEILFDN